MHMCVSTCGNTQYNILYCKYGGVNVCVNQVYNMHRMIVSYMVRVRLPHHPENQIEAQSYWPLEQRHWD